MIADVLSLDYMLMIREGLMPIPKTKMFMGIGRSAADYLMIFTAANFQEGLVEYSDDILFMEI